MFRVLSLSLCAFFINQTLGVKDDFKTKVIIQEDRRILLLPFDVSQQIVVDTLKNQSILITHSDCYVKNVHISQPFRTYFKKWTQRKLVSELKPILIYNGTQYSSEILKEQVPNVIRPFIELLCRAKKVWMLWNSPEVLPTLEDYLAAYERNKSFELDVSVKRAKRHAQVGHQFRLPNSRRNYMADQGVLSNQRNGEGALIEGNQPEYNGRPLFTQNNENGRSFRHYHDFYSNSVLHNRTYGGEENPGSSHLYQPDKYYEQNANKNLVGGNLDHSDNSNSNYGTSHFSAAGYIRPDNYDYDSSPNEQEEELIAADLPSTIVKNGQLFYRHGSSRKDGSQDSHQPYEETISNDHANTNTDSDHSPRVKNSAYESRPLSAFDFISQSRGSEQPSRMISAAAAAMIESTSDGGTTSRLIGTATKGGYFSARTHGVDSNGAGIHSHIKGDGKMASGSVLSIKTGRQVEVKSDAKNKNGILSFAQAHLDDHHSLVSAQVLPSNESYTQEIREVVNSTHNNEELSHTSDFAQEDEYYDLQPNSHSIIQNAALEHSYVNNNYLPYNNENHHRGYIDPQLGKTRSYLSNPIIDQNGLTVGAGVPPRESDFEQVIETNVPEGGEKDSRVGLVTAPFHIAGLPPGPGELLGMSNFFVNDHESNVDSMGKIRNNQNLDNMMIKPSHLNILKPPMIEEDLTMMPEPRIPKNRTDFNIIKQGLDNNLDLSLHTNFQNLPFQYESPAEETHHFIQKISTNDTISSSSSFPTRTTSKLIRDPVIEPDPNISTFNSHGQDVNRAYIDQDDKRGFLTQRYGTPLEAGESIPGLPGYHIPVGFRGKVIYGHTLPVEVESKKVVKGYNTHVQLQPSSTPGEHPIYASVSGPEGSASFPSNGKSGVHITLSGASSAVASPYSSSSSASVVSRVGNNWPSNNIVNMRRSFTRNNNFVEDTQSLANTRNDNQRASNSISNNVNGSIQSNSKMWSKYRNRKVSDTKNKNCGHYRNQCTMTNTPYQKAQICKPIYLTLPCCC